MLTSYRLGNLEINPGLVLAPMSGVTCMSFRTLIKELNPGSVGMVVTEFISVEALTRQVRRSLDMMRHKSIEHPFCIQIFGYDTDRMRDGALMAQDAGADIIDINCGCPAPKVVRKGGGCELMRQPTHLQKIVETVRAAVSVPLTLKMRSGWDQDSRNCLDIAHMCEQSGVNAIAIHGRTRAQLYRGDADWGMVWKVRDSVSIPVLGSGDVVDVPSYLERVLRPQELDQEREQGSANGRKTLDGALIGRGALMNPFIFDEIVTGVKKPLRSDTSLAVSVLERYADLLTEEFLPKARTGKIKQLASQMLRGHAWRKELLRVNTFEEQRKILSAVREGTYSASGASSGGLGASDMGETENETGASF
jgi:tRNA-dihydrouridine synthase B